MGGAVGWGGIRQLLQRWRTNSGGTANGGSVSPWNEGGISRSDADVAVSKCHRRCPRVEGPSARQPPTVQSGTRIKCYSVKVKNAQTCRDKTRRASTRLETA